MFRLDNKVALIVGGATGLGAASARTMAAAGATVLIGDVHPERGEAVVDEIRGAGGEAAIAAVDVSDDQQVKALVAEAVARFGRVDILHSNAAAYEDSEVGVDSVHDIVTLPLAVWDRSMAVNVTGAMLACRHVIPEMLKGGRGSIIVTSSTVAFSSEHVRGAYAASKAAISGLVRHVAIAYGKQGIRCNAIAPGLMITRDTPQSLIDMQVRHHLTPRLGVPQDMGYLATFLASDEAEFITGTTIMLDGGLLSHIPQLAEVKEAANLNPGVPENYEGGKRPVAR